MSRTRKILSAASVLAILAAAATVSGQPAFTPRGPVPFAVLDADGDGTVTEQEFVQHRNQRQAWRAAQGRMLRHARWAPDFAAFDTDGNGRLTPPELAAVQQTRMLARGMARRPCLRGW